VKFLLPSDFLGTVIARTNVEFRSWAVVVLELWNADPRVHKDFDGDVVRFFDWAFATSEALIRSAQITEGK
jgi:hypothetical protein